MPVTGFKFNPISSTFDIVSVTGGGGSSNSFTTIQPDNGTSPVATTPTDTLTLHNTDGNIVITGNSSTDTITFNLATNPVITGNFTVDGTTSLDSGAITTDGSGNLIINSLESDMSAFGIGELGDAQFGTNSLGFSITPDNDASSSRLIWSNSGSWQINGDGSASLANVVLNSSSTSAPVLTIDAPSGMSSDILDIFINGAMVAGIDSFGDIFSGNLNTGTYSLISPTGLTMAVPGGDAGQLSWVPTGSSDGGYWLAQDGVDGNTGFQANYFSAFIGPYTVNLSASQLTFSNGLTLFGINSGTSSPDIQDGANWEINGDGSTSFAGGSLTVDSSGDLSTTGYVAANELKTNTLIRFPTLGILADDGNGGIQYYYNGGSPLITLQQSGILNFNSGVFEIGPGATGSEGFIDTNTGNAAFSGAITSFAGSVQEITLSEDGGTSNPVAYFNPLAGATGFEFYDITAGLPVAVIGTAGNSSSFAVGAVTIDNVGNISTVNGIAAGAGFNTIGGAFNVDGGGNISASTSFSTDGGLINSSGTGDFSTSSGVQLFSGNSGTSSPDIADLNAASWQINGDGSAVFASGALNISSIGGLGAYGATPPAQQTALGITAGFTPHTSANTVFNESTFTGNTGTSAYTISDIVAALKHYGLLAS